MQVTFCGSKEVKPVPALSPARIHPWMYLWAVILTCLAPVARGQIYSPRTEEHDPAQRFFLTETCRLLSWRESMNRPGFKEVTNSVYRMPKGQVEWRVRFRDESGSLSKTGVIAYSTNLLQQGDEFYRSVFSQLQRLSWKESPKVTAASLREAYWKGASSVRPSREESLSEAFQFVAKHSNQWNPSHAAELSGLLTHSVLPGVPGRLSIDSVLLARSLGWLAFAEAACGEKLSDLYIPALFLAGRESWARSQWTTSRSKGLIPTNQITSGWDVWLGPARSKEFYRFAVKNRGSVLLMPMLIYDSLVNDSTELMEEFIPALLPGTSASLQHNYGPYLTAHLSVGVGHFTGGRWAVWQRLAWLKLMRTLRPGTLGMTNVAGILDQVALGLDGNRGASDVQDASLVGLKAFSPILRLGHREGIGALTPVAVATDRDLLNYGWEAAGLQMGARYRFVAHMWGIEDAGNSIRLTSRSAAEGWSPFFEREVNSKVATYRESLKRLELVEGLSSLVGFNRHFYADTEAENPHTALRFLRQAWLRPRDFDWQWRTLYDGGDSVSNITTHLRWAAEEAGPRGLAVGVGYLGSMIYMDRQKIPGAVEATSMLAEKLPQKSVLYLRTMERSFTNRMGGASSLDELNWRDAQFVEKLYWENPGDDLAHEVLKGYLQQDGYPSVVRFYSQVHEDLVNQIRFSHTLAERLFLVSHFETNSAMQEWVLENSRSGSGSDMRLQMLRAVTKGSIPMLEASVKEYLDRYGTDAKPRTSVRLLQDFIPLLPSLENAKGPDYQRALDYFSDTGEWPIFRWLWVQRFKLPTEDAITFLGGRENEPFLGFLVHYLLNDREEMGKMYRAYAASRQTDASKSFILRRLWNEVEPKKATPKDEDLRPPGAKSLRAQIHEWLRE